MQNGIIRGGLNPINYFIDIAELNAYQRYITTTRSSIEDIIPKLDELLLEADFWEGETVNITDESKKLDTIVLNEVINIYYNSTLISLYSFMERKLFHMCRRMQEQYSLKVRHLAGNGIQKYRNYLQRVVGISFDPINTSWDYLLKIGHIRNILVHNTEQMVDTNATNLIEFLETNENFHVRRDTNGATIFKIIDKEIINEVSKNIRGILDFLYWE